MKGFLRRDLSLLRLGLWFYPVVLIVAAFVGSRFFSRVRGAGFAVYLLLVFGAECLQSLMTYDGMNGWHSYAAAVPGGRKKMVNARYLLSLLIALVLAVVILLLTLLRGEGLPLWAAGFYGSAFLFTISATLPVGYRNSGSGGRLAFTIVTFVLVGVLGGLFSGVLQSAREDLAQGLLRTDVNGFFSVLSLDLPLLGLGTLALSWRLSRHIMEKKEF